MHFARRHNEEIDTINRVVDATAYHHLQGGHRDSLLQTHAAARRCIQRGYGDNLHQTPLLEDTTAVNNVADFLTACAAAVGEAMSLPSPQRFADGAATSPRGAAAAARCSQRPPLERFGYEAQAAQGSLHILSHCLAPAAPSDAGQMPLLGFAPHQFRYQAAIVALASDGRTIGRRTPRVHAPRAGKRTCTLFETCNGTCWASLQKRLLETQAAVLLGQEVK